ncbi:hypothetical protein KIH31_08485 [Paenarthrobacter sp. DKR-5]|uniref:hypothetical protein n=1 Tax=Paenarthrobacter sp. DKR-5 TaxID=2835535 RepID=UPI001BDDC106|nr:hypothetical protein [Paenarthrobacter sp. DKR-5]MBT1002638.1 hypothetical protein [Paenarthrobacter sp. DKR-5]
MTGEDRAAVTGVFIVSNPARFGLPDTSGGWGLVDLVWPASGTRATAAVDRAFTVMVKEAYDLGMEVDLPSRHFRLIRGGHILDWERVDDPAAWAEVNHG